MLIGGPHNGYKFRYPGLPRILIELDETFTYHEYILISNPQAPNPYNIYRYRGALGRPSWAPAERKADRA